MVFRRLKQGIRHRRLRANGISVDCQLTTVAYGARSGSWTIYPEAIEPGSVVYSFGVGNNIKWDLELIANHRVELHAFDPTPRSVNWIDKQSLPAEFHFHPMGLSNRDGAINFYVPVKEYKINYSSYKSKSPDGETVSCPVKRFGTLISDLGHSKVDIVKMDIEGGEVDVLPDMLSGNFNIGQLLVEFHYNFPNIAFEEFADLIAMLRDEGFRIYHISERAYEFSFIHQSVL